MKIGERSGGGGYVCYSDDGDGGGDGNGDGDGDGDGDGGGGFWNSERAADWLMGNSGRG